jgi:hypothetical protein
MEKEKMRGSRKKRREEEEDEEEKVARKALKE